MAGDPLPAAAPRPGAVAPTAAAAALTVLDAVALTVGVVVGAGIFKLPSLVAGNVRTGDEALLLWLLGGVVSLIGALCYAELATAYPHTGGDYHYLRRAFGEGVAFLFGWARMAVIQTGSIALQAFLIGDYASEILRLGPVSSSVYAALVIVAVTAVNLAGIRQGRTAQKVLTAATVLGLAAVAVAGLFFAPAAAAAAPPTGESAAAAVGVSPAWGLAMVFVLLTYGGWNEAAYISAELRDVRRDMARALVWSIAAVTAIYLLANFAYLRGLGVGGVARSEAVAADLLRAAAGEPGARLVSLIISVAALSTINATVITGARSMQALGADHRQSVLGGLARWSESAGTPRAALIGQGVVALLLVLFGTLTRDGFATMVDYTAPVFWLFFLLVGVSLFVLRRKDADRERPFRVPLYPLTPLLFCAVCAYMLQASLAYTRVGALVGVAVLLLGVPLLWWARAARARAADATLDAAAAVPAPIVVTPPAG